MSVENSPASKQHPVATSGSLEISEARKILYELRKKIRKSGVPPHSDFWHQSLHEAKERLREAITNNSKNN